MAYVCFSFIVASFEAILCNNFEYRAGNPFKTVVFPLAFPSNPPNKGFVVYFALQGAQQMAVSLLCSL